MKTLIPSILISTFVGSLISATSAEMCGATSDRPCPFGFYCASNGFIHTCQMLSILTKRQRCAPVSCLPCAHGYGYGYELDVHGCLACRCVPAKRAACLLQLCGLYCPDGYKVGAAGCPYCACN